MLVCVVNRIHRGIPRHIGLTAVCRGKIGWGEVQGSRTVKQHGCSCAPCVLAGARRGYKYRCEARSSHGRGVWIKYRRIEHMAVEISAKGRVLQALSTPRHGKQLVRELRCSTYVSVLLLSCLFEFRICLFVKGAVFVFPPLFGSGGLGTRHEACGDRCTGLFRRAAPLALRFRVATWCALLGV